MQWEDAKHLARRHMERGQAHLATTNDINSEECSMEEGQKSEQFFDTKTHISPTTPRDSQLGNDESNPGVLSKQQQLYVVMIRY